MGIEIKQITEDLIESYHQALDVVARERRYLTLLHAPPLERTREFVLHNIANNHPQLVAMTEDQVIGWCDVLPKGQPIFAHSAVLGMGLLPEFRNRGIGALLVRTALEMARTHKLARIELSVFSDNLPAIKLYERFGFRIEGELVADALIDGEFRNSLLMAIVDQWSIGN